MMDVVYWKSNTYGAPQGKCLHYKKVIVDFVEDDFAMVENDMVRYKGKWGMLNANRELIIPTDYAFIDFFRNEAEFKVALGDLVLDYGSDLHSYVAWGAKWGVINEINQVMVPIQYDWIEELALNNYAVNIGCTLEYNDGYQEDYWFAKNGKWGVINSDNKIIVPIEYDSYYHTASKFKDFIFVQKGKPYFDEQEPYDVFDYNGNILYNNIQGFVERRFGYPTG
jgi:hypothetical protein